MTEDKKYWKTLLPQLLNSQEEKDYYSQMKTKLKNTHFYTNVEK